MQIILVQVFIFINSEITTQTWLISNGFFPEFKSTLQICSDRENKNKTSFLRLFYGYTLTTKKISFLSQIVVDQRNQRKINIEIGKDIIRNLENIRSYKLKFFIMS